MLGRSLTDLGLTQETVPKHLSVKEAVLPFDRFPDVDTLLGPEMKSTGEVMGIDMEFGAAYAKAQFGARMKLPTEGVVFISVKKTDRGPLLPIAAQFRDLGFLITATRGTSLYLAQNGIPNRAVNKVSSGRPHVVDAIKNGEIQLVINTGSGDKPRRDGYLIRRASLKFNLPYATTLAGAMAMSKAIKAIKEKTMSVKPIQEYHT
jgi:carbamoyl-phosphate synthase large subunit